MPSRWRSTPPRSISDAGDPRSPGVVSGRSSDEVSGWPPISHGPAHRDLVGPLGPIRAEGFGALVLADLVPGTANGEFEITGEVVHRCDGPLVVEGGNRVLASGAHEVPPLTRVGIRRCEGPRIVVSDGLAVRGPRAPGVEVDAASQDRDREFDVG